MVQFIYGDYVGIWEGDIWRRFYFVGKLGLGIFSFFILRRQGILEVLFFRQFFLVRNKKGSLNLMKYIYRVGVYIVLNAGFCRSRVGVIDFINLISNYKNIRLGYCVVEKYSNTYFGIEKSFIQCLIYYKRINKMIL